MQPEDWESSNEWVIFDVPEEPDAQVCDYYIINDVLYYIIDGDETEEEGQLVSRIFNSHCV